MRRMWHRGAALAAVMAMACSSTDEPREPGAPAAPDGDDEGEPSDTEESESVLEFAIDGRDEPLGAQARLDVYEGERVHLLITGADGEEDLVMFDIYFEGVESTMGAHTIELGLPLPDTKDNQVNASLDGEVYYSQAGRLELVLAEDGSIQGRFEVDMAHDESELGAPPAPIVLSDDALTLSGGFEGSWLLSCRSRLPGHETLMSGGAFCENLDF